MERDSMPALAVEGLTSLPAGSLEDGLGEFLVDILSLWASLLSRYVLGDCGKDKLSDPMPTLFTEIRGKPKLALLPRMGKLAWLKLLDRGDAFGDGFGDRDAPLPSN